MRLSLCLSLLCLTIIPASAQRFVKVFDNIGAMLAANPNDVHTNAFVAGHTTANDGRGGIYTWNSASTTATNENLSVLKANNFATGRWFRDNGFILSNFTTNTVVVVGPNGILTNSVITLTEINTLIGIGGNIQQQINNLIALDTNWENDGPTNANLVGIGRLWQLIATNSVHVGQPGEAGYIDISSTNGTYTVRTTVDENGTLIVSNAVHSVVRFESDSTNDYRSGFVKAGRAVYSWAELGSYEGDALSKSQLSLGWDDVTTNATLVELIAHPSDGSSINIFEGLGFAAMMTLWPSVADGGTPYVYDTTVPHTTGDLMVVKNDGTARATISATGSFTLNAVTTNDWIWMPSGFFVNNHGDLELNAGGGTAEVQLQPADTTLPFKVSSARTVGAGTAHTAFQNNHTNIVEWNGSGGGIFHGTLMALTSVNVLSRAYGAACSDLTTPIVVGTTQGIIRLPHKMTLTEVRASVKTAQTSGAILTFDVLENGVSILSNPITIDNGETSSKDAASQPVISDTALADNAEITLDTTQVGDGTAIGLQFWVIGTIAP